MKKRILSLILAIDILLGLTVSLPVVAAEESFSYGCMLAYGWTEDFGVQTLELKFADKDGNETSYSCSNTIVINGTEYTYYSVREIEEVIPPTGAFCEFALQDGKIAAINSDESGVRYENRTYDTDTKTFSSLGASASGLPIYYRYGDYDSPVYFAPAYLDENHLYTLYVYDYAIEVVEMRALNKDETVEYLNVSHRVNGEFLQDILVYCETTSEDSEMVAQLYKDGEFLREESLSCSHEAEVVFSGLPNVDASYSVKVWLEDESGNAISHVYEESCLTEEVSILTEKVIAYGFESSFGITELSIKTSDLQGNETTYPCKNPIVVNETWYRYAEEWADSVPIGNYIRFAVEDGIIVAISENIPPKEEWIQFDAEEDKISIYSPEEISNVSYMVALYRDGRLIGIVPATTELCVGANEIDSPVNYLGAADRVQIFVWKNFDTLKPMFCSGVADLTQ